MPLRLHLEVSNSSMTSSHKRAYDTLDSICIQLFAYSTGICPSALTFWSKQWYLRQAVL